MEETDRRSTHSSTLLLRIWRRPEVAIGAGAVVGANLRYFAVALLGQSVPTTFPTGTMLVNLAGSLLIGIAHTLFTAYRPVSPAVPLFVSVGLLGGFTTFSTFSVETVQLIDAGRVTDALLYQGLSLCGAMPAVYAGMGLGRAAYQLRDRWRRR